MSNKMRKKLVVGILREAKEGESRTPLVPSHAKWLIKRGVAVEVECNPGRVFSDQEYRKNGARILDRIKAATILLGIKAPRVADLQGDKIYMIFSHTSKGQSNNMPLIKTCLKKKIALIDYEKIVDEQGKRLVYFGRLAGVCGLVDSLYYLGKKLEWKGVKNPFSLLQPAHAYGSFKAVKQAMADVGWQIQHRGFEKKLAPFIIGIIGHGNVSRGVQEILQFLNPVEIHPEDMLRIVRRQRGIHRKLYKIVFPQKEKLRSKDGKEFYFDEYLKNPKKFESNLDRHLSYLNILIHAGYWDHRYPRLVTKEMVHNLTRKDLFRLDFISDISCDINGSIELTYKTTTSINPTFTYDPKKKKFIDGYESKGITILAVDNLAAELPKDSSREFSGFIRNYVYQIAVCGVKAITNHIALPEEIRRAVVTESSELTKNFGYLRKYIQF